MERRDARETLSTLLEGRQVIWAGLRDEDAGTLIDVPGFSHSFCILGADGSDRPWAGLAHERLTGYRPDLETWDIDEDLDTSAARQFRAAILSALDGRSALLPYRPSRFLSALTFMRQESCLNLGLFGGHQAAFDHKPWVETSLRGSGVHVMPWQYVGDHEQDRIVGLLQHGPLILRRSRTSGGEGITKVSTQEGLAANLPTTPETYVCVAPFLDGGLPINVSGTVWRDGVTVGYPSVQLIGIEGAATRPFGYCGNDFGAMDAVDDGVLHRIEESTHDIGRWLARYGYRGTFGVDFLLHDGVLWFTEVNPRFQGSSHVSALLSREVGTADLYMEHILAMLDHPKPPQRPYVEQVRDLPAKSHLVVHSTAPTAGPADLRGLLNAFGDVPFAEGADVLADPGLVVAPGAVIARLHFRDVVTQQGTSLLPSIREALDLGRSG